MQYFSHERPTRPISPKRRTVLVYEGFPSFSSDSHARFTKTGDGTERAVDKILLIKSKNKQNKNNYNYNYNMMNTTILGFAYFVGASSLRGAFAEANNLRGSPFPTTAPPLASRTVTATTCGCATCDATVLNTFAGDFSCGDRISYLQNSLGYSETDACAQIGATEFPVECGGCDPNRCNENPNPITLGQVCGGAVNSSNDAQSVCQSDLWDPTGDSTMYCFSYGGSGDPCHLNNNNDPDNGIYKNPLLCTGDTFYLWDEPDTQGYSYEWAGRTWLEYSRRFPDQLRILRERGTKITSPMLRAGDSGALQANLEAFLDGCGDACTTPNDPAYIDVIAVNAFCGDFNLNGCRGGAAFIYNEAVGMSNAHGNLPVYITNWSRLQTSNPNDQLEAIDAIDAFFPSTSSNPIVERVYWFGATDFGGGTTNNLLADTLIDGSTLGQAWKNKCDSLQ